MTEIDANNIKNELVICSKSIVADAPSTSSVIMILPSCCGFKFIGCGFIIFLPLNTIG